VTERFSCVRARSAASEITSEMTQGFVSSVTLAVDFVFDSLLDKLDSIYYSQKGGSGGGSSAPPPLRQAESSGNVNVISVSARVSCYVARGVDGSPRMHPSREPA
jgi:hypothetical protein